MARLPEELNTKLEQWRVEGKTVVFTNGVFDLLHPGHLAVLEAARKLGDVLVVGMNSDASARKLAKGPGRPVQNEESRYLMLAALRCVNAVAVFDEPTPLELIKLVRPDVLVKGADYAKAEVVGSDFVEALGGRVELVPLAEGYSTTDLITRIKEQT